MIIKPNNILNKFLGHRNYAVDGENLPQDIDVYYFKKDEEVMNEPKFFKRGDIGILFIHSSDEDFPGYFFYFDGKKWKKYLQLIEGD